jgi:hypothetical protein
MSENSRKRRLLLAERRIRRYFLNFNPRFLGNYTQRQLRHAESYVIHVHAEIECYFEDMVAFALNRAEQKWLLQKAATRPLVFLTSFYNKTENISSLPETDIWQDRVTAAIDAHRQNLFKNHGIKTRNIMSLYAPVGFDVRNIDEILLSELNAFGTQRGSYAHSSIHARAGAVFDPFLFEQQATRLLSLLDPFDAEIRQFIQQV